MSLAPWPRSRGAPRRAMARSHDGSARRERPARSVAPSEGIRSACSSPATASSLSTARSAATAATPGVVARTGWRSNAPCFCVRASASRRASARRGDACSSSSGVASLRAHVHHRCPVSDTIPVTHGLGTGSRLGRHYGRIPLSTGRAASKERVMNSKHRPGEYAGSGDDTEGQSFKRTATADEDDTEGQSFKRTATADEDDTEGQSFKRTATTDEDDTEGQSFKRTATADEDDTEGQSFKRTATADEDDTEGQSFKRTATADEDDTEGQSFK